MEKKGNDEELLKLVNNCLKRVDRSLFKTKFKRRFKHKKDRENIKKYNEYRIDMKKKLNQLKSRILKKDITKKLWR